MSTNLTIIDFEWVVKRLEFDDSADLVVIFSDASPCEFLVSACEGHPVVELDVVVLVEAWREWFIKREAIEDIPS